MLQQNRELLEHLASFGGFTEATDRPGLTAATIGIAPQVRLKCELFIKIIVKFTSVLLLRTNTNTVTMF